MQSFWTQYVSLQFPEYNKHVNKCSFSILIDAHTAAIVLPLPSAQEYDPSVGCLLARLTVSTPECQNGLSQLELFSLPAARPGVHYGSKGHDNTSR